MIFCGTDLRFLLLLLVNTDDDNDDEMVAFGKILCSSINETMFVDVVDKAIGLVELFESLCPFKPRTKEKEMNRKKNIRVNLPRDRNNCW